MASTRALRPSLGNLLTQCTRPTTTSSPSPSSILLLRQQQPQLSSQIPSSSQLFSTTTPHSKRHTYIGARKFRDANKHRGESTIRRTGTRWRLSVSDEPLPKPVPKSEIPRVETDPDHGLYDFFYEKDRIVLAPSEMIEHGRAWSVQELRAKSWDDLHALWWVCLRERNRIGTVAWERKKARLGFGTAEDSSRDKVVKQTMKCIKFVLTERYYAWEDAYKLAAQDPEINLANAGTREPIFTPREYFEEEEVDDAFAPTKPENAGEEKKAAVETAEAGEVKLNVDPSTLPNAPSAGEVKEAPRA